MTITSEVDLTERRLQGFLTDIPFYVRSEKGLVEQLVVEMADSRDEAVILESAIERCIQEGKIVLGEPEFDDPNIDPRMPPKGTCFTRRVRWQH